MSRLCPKSMNALSKVVVKAPVKIGESVVEDFLGLKVNVVAAGSVNPN